MIPHSRPYFDASDAEAVQQVVATGYTACGSISFELEQVVKQRLGMPDAVAVDSGTSALMLAVRALKQTQTVKRVGIPAYACASLLFAVRAAGCEPVAMDCDVDLRLNKVKARALEASLDVVILVHPFGMIEPMVSEQWACPVIEDIAQAAGAIFKGKQVGGFGDISITSFYATKPWGGAYGGMLMADNDMCERVRTMRNPDMADFTQVYVGHHQLSDIHAALALKHIEKSDEELELRTQHVEWLDKLLPAQYVSSIAQRNQGSMYRYIIRQQDKAELLIQCLRSHGVGAERPVQMPYDMALGKRCDGAQHAWNDCVSLPIITRLSDDEKDAYKQAIKACVV